jgi:oxygen-independent coproporphyrinogen-3 oxidase
MPTAGGGLYVHLPFCPYLCPYCDFAKWPLRRSSAERYLAALEAEIAGARAFAARTLFLGGGTPNTYAPDRIGALVARLRERFAPEGFVEATIELNPDPDLCTDEAFAAYARAGIDRLSFGVQSMDPAELAALGRRHRPGDVVAAVGRARAAGFENISLDVIFGTPGQTLDSWHATLEAVLALEPAHVSTYGLTIEEGTPFADWFARAPGDFVPNDLEADLYALAIATLTSRGFEHYEVSNFARPARRARHNENYWRNGEYLGLGVGAASYRDGVRSVNVRDLERYCTAALAGDPVPNEAERLEGSARVGEAVMLALRTAEGVDIAAFAERYGIDVLALYRPVLTDMRANGTLVVTPTHVRLSPRGRFVANDVCAAFVTFEGA